MTNPKLTDDQIKKKCTKCSRISLPRKSLCQICTDKKAARRNAKKERGECAYCINPVGEKSKSLCDDHFTQRLAKDQIRKSDLQDKKLCLTCKLPNDTNNNNCQSCKDTRNLSYQERINNGLCKYCDTIKMDSADYCQEHADYYRDYNKNLRKLVYSKYGDVCACCGEDIFEFLSIDHVNNDGYLDKKAGIRGTGLLQKIIKESFPDKYQILCHNCNMGKAINFGICPHKMLYE